MGEFVFAGASGGGISASPAALICPTRGRPAEAARLTGAWAGTAQCSDLIFCVDDDDPALPGYRALWQAETRQAGIIYWLKGPRKSLAAWTNTVAREYAGLYQGLMSLGDDHVPENPPGFDRKLLDAAQSGGGGFAYGDDGLQHENLPTAWMVTTNIVKALGWMCLPGTEHMFLDAAVRDLAEAAGCRRYLPHVSVRHLHHSARLSPVDQTYRDGEASWAADEKVYRAWLEQGLAGDAATVEAAIRA
jgi:hypothetical protein